MRSDYPPAIFRAFRAVIVPYAVTRLALIAIALWAAASVPFGVKCDPCDLTSSPLLNALSRWDGEWYVAIARDGYSYVPGVRSSVTFSPLLPALMRGLAGIFGRVDDTSLVVAGIVIAHAALLAALAYLLSLGKLEGDEASGRRAALYLLVFPTSIFLGAVYPSSLFLLLGIGTVAEARRGRWALATVLAGLGALARPFGIALAVPLVVQAFSDRTRPRPVLRFAAAAVPLAAFAGWQLYLYRLFGDPLLYVHAQQAYGRNPSLPLQEVADLLDPGIYGFPWLVGGIFSLMAVLVIWSWRRLHPATAACGTAILLAELSSGTLTSFPRYALALFPAFLVLAMLGARRPVHVAYLAVASALCLLLTAMFASWYWIG